MATAERPGEEMEACRQTMDPDQDRGEKDDTTAVEMVAETWLAVAVVVVDKMVPMAA